MRKYIFIIILMLLSGRTTVHAQMSAKEITAQIAECESILSTDPDAAFLLMKKLRSEADVRDNLEWSAKTDLLFIDYYTKKLRIEKVDSLLIECAEKFEAIDDQNGLAETFQKKGYLAVYTGQYDEAVKVYKESRDIFRSINNAQKEGELTSMLGRAYQIKGDIEAAINTYQSALEISEKENDTTQIATCYYLLAGVHGVKGQFSMAINFVEKSIKLYKAIGDEINLLPALLIRNIFQTKIGLNNEVIESSEDILQLVKKGGDAKFEGVVYGNVSTAYLNLNKPALALPYAQKGYQIFKDAQHAISEPLFLRILGQCYEGLEQYDTAFKYYDESIEKFRAQNTLNELGVSLFHAGFAQVKHADTNLGISHCSEAFEYSTQFNLLDLKNNACRCLYEGYKKLGSTGMAFEYLELHKKYADSLKIDDNRNTLVKYQLIQKNQLDSIQNETEKLEIQLMHENANRNKNFLFWGLLMIAATLLTSLGALLFYNQKKRKLSEKNASLQREETKRLAELDQMKTNLYTNITHEFRTPLTVISGLADELRNKKDKRKEYAEVIKRNGHRLLNLVNQMLDLAKAESGFVEIKYQNGEIIQYLRYILASFESYAGQRKIALHFLSDIGAIHMDYDVEKLLQIISNLISNALKFTPEEGDIYLQIHKSKSFEGEMLSIKIKDTGIGISEEGIKHIFDRFYREDNNGSAGEQSSGIGLALTKELVQMLDGDITAQSKLGQGTQISVMLPIRNREGILPVRIQQKSIEQAVQTFVPNNVTGVNQQTPAYTLNEMPRLLIVEDNVDIVNYLKDCLSDEYEITSANDGSLGIQKAQNEIPDIIISDVMMPGKSGYELCEELKTDELTSHIPIVMLTAKADFSDRLTGIESGADAYLLKPFDKKELKATLKNLIDLRKKLHVRYSQEWTNEQTLKVERIEDDFILKVKEVIISNIDIADFGIVHVCQKLRLSRSQLHNKLKALTGISASIFIRKVRLHHAKKLLIDQSLNISEVAYASGFNDPAYFTRCFSEEYGESPSEFRNQK